MGDLVLLAHPGCEHGAAVIADRLNLVLVMQAEQIAAEYYLEYNSEGLALVRMQDARQGGPQKVRCDFVAGALRHRRLFGGGSKQALARAVGISAKFKPNIADLTAGLGRDGFVLASLGADVTLVERNEVVAALLADGLERLRQYVDLHADDHDISDPSLKTICHRLSSYNLDSKAWLQALRSDNRLDVIYLDPMFPERTKSAKVKKEMAVFPGLVGDDADAGELLESALDTAHYRVVVKRPRRAPALAAIRPGFSIDGKTTRFDIYSLKKIPR